MAKAATAHLSINIGNNRDRSMSTHPPQHKSSRGESCSKSYTLATGEAAAHRLELLQRVYGPATLRLLETAGVKRGVSVADLGCGVGTVTEVLSRLVDAEGRVVGVDFSGAQL